jgi:hypothetical protein
MMRPLANGPDPWSEWRSLPRKIAFGAGSTIVLLIGAIAVVAVVALVVTSLR